MPLDSGSGQFDDTETWHDLHHTSQAFDGCYSETVPSFILHASWFEVVAHSCVTWGCRGRVSASSKGRGWGGGPGLRDSSGRVRCHRDAISRARERVRRLKPYSGASLVVLQKEQNKKKKNIVPRRRFYRSCGQLRRVEDGGFHTPWLEGGGAGRECEGVVPVEGGGHFAVGDGD